MPTSTNLPEVNGFPINVATQTQAVTFNGFKSIEDKAMYDRALIQPLRNEGVLGQFTEKRKMPKHHGKTITFRKSHRIQVPASMKTNGLEEGVIPAPNAFGLSEFSATIKRFADWIRYSDESLEFPIDDLYAVMVDEMGWAYKDFIEELRLDLMRTSKNLWYAGVDASKVTTKTQEEFTKAITAKGIVLSDLPKISAFFARNHVKGAKGNYFVFLVAPEVGVDLLSLKKSSAEGEYTFVEINQAQQTDVVYTGELGKILRFAFVTTESIHIGDGNVCECLVLGKVRNKWGTEEISLEGESAPEVINKPIGSGGTNDPVNQVGTIGWKVHGWGGLVTAEEAVMRYVCKTTVDEYDEYADENRNGFVKKTVFSGSETTDTNKPSTQDPLTNGAIVK